MKKILLLFVLLTNIFAANAQYADKHYIAPSPWQYWSDANEIVVTTRETTPVTVTLKKSNGTFITTLSVVALSPVSYRFVGNPATVTRNTINTVLTDRGLIVEATAPVSINLRNIASDTPGTNVNNIKGNASLVSFGNEGIGLKFRLGYYRSSYVGISSGAPVYSVMALQDATIVSLNNSPIGILNTGQSRLFTAPMGALLSADKPIVANSGAYGDTPQACGGSGEDGVVDQIAPVNMLGTQYIVVRGNGSVGTGADYPEQSTIIASENNTTISVINYNSGGFQFSTNTYTLPTAGSYITIFQGDAASAYSSSFISASSPVIVYSGTADGCETDMSTVLPIGGCSGSTDIATRKFVNYTNANLSYFGYCILESDTEPVFMNGTNLETLIGSNRIPLGISGFNLIRFNNTNIGNPTNINITSLARLTTSIIQQGQGSSMSGFFSAFSDSPEPPTEVTSTDPCTKVLSTTAGLDPYQWYLDGNPIAGAITQTYTPTLIGNYTVKGTRSCGPTPSSAPVYFVPPSCSDLAIQKTVTVSGNQAVFVVTASNLGAANDIDVIATDLLPSGYTLISAVPSAGTTYNSTTGVWDIGNLIVGATPTLTVTVTINATGNFLNVAAISGTNNDPDTTNNTAQQQAGTSTMSLTKSAQNPVYYNPGEVINYSLVLTNTGQNVINGITITDANADTGSINPAGVATLNLGASVTITATHTITAADVTNGFVLNQATAAGQNTALQTITVTSDDPSTAVANDPTRTLVTVGADIVTVNTNNQAVYTPGTSTTYTVTVTNNGPSTAQNVVINDAVPAGITVMTWTSSLGTSGTGPINETLPTMVNGATVTYTVTVTIPASYTGTLTNTVVVSSSTTDPDPSCTQCTDTDNGCTPPAVTAAGPVKKCDDTVADGFTTVNLTQFNSTISQGDTSVQLLFYLTPADVAAANPIASPQAFTNTVAYDQTVIVEVISSTGCKSYTNLQVLVSQLPTPITALSYQVCDDGTHLFDLTQYETAILNGQSGTAVTGYYTTPANAATPTAAITDAGSHPISSASAVFYARVENANGCYVISELTLNIFGAPQVTLPQQLSICMDAAGVVTPGLLESGLSSSDYTFKWFHDNVQLPDNGNTLWVSAAGNYTVEVTSLIGCSGGTSNPTLVILSNGPDTFDAEVTTGYFAGDAIIQATATGNGDFVYWLDYGAEQQSGIFHNVRDGLHDVYVKDANGCGQILSVQVRVIDYPKFFTPNGDTFNDFWNITGIRDQPQSAIFIFDRYGKLLTEIKPFGPGWDGTYNGQALPSTDYWFKVLYTEKGMPQEFRAHFSLKR